MNISYSSISTFKSCPLRYKFQEIDKIKTPNSPEKEFGSLMHSVMQFIHSGNFVTPSLQEALAFFTNSWKPEIFPDEFSERSAFASGVAIIKRYYQKNDPGEIPVAALESRFAIEIIDEENKNEKHLLSGIIDRIDKTEDGYEIIDYKTARKLPAQKTTDQNEQLLIYLLAFLDRYPKEVENISKIKLSLYFLHHGVKISTVKNKEELADAKKEILKTISEIKTSKFEPKVSALCDWCAFQRNCPMWRHKFKDEKIDEPEKTNVIEEFIQLSEEIKTRKSRLQDLQEKVLQIMEAEKVSRLFGKNKIITLAKRLTSNYDEEKLKEIFLNVGRWEEIISVNKTKLKKVLEVAPKEVKDQVSAIETKKETPVLLVKKDKENRMKMAE